jgi:site-specific recombinase XerD
VQSNENLNEVTNERDNWKPNQVYYNGMYNEEAKNEFLEQKHFSPITKKSYQRIFLNSYRMENALNKDLADFNLDEISEVLTSLNPLTPSASRSNISVIYNYITWAMERGYRTVPSNINPLETVKHDKEFIQKFTDKNVVIYISKDELDQLTDPNTGCVNAQDGVLFSLLFDGLSVHEICNLKKSDVDFKNRILHLTDDKGHKRELKIPEWSNSLELIQEAIEETEYKKRNNEAVILSNQTNVTMLVENDYVVRVGKTKNRDASGAVQPSVIYRRLSTISELWENPYLSSKNIQRSGVIFDAYLIYKETGKLEKSEYIRLCELHNFPKVKNGKYEFYNWSPLQEYVSFETMKRLGYDI